MSNNVKKRQKLCLNCDASIDIDVIVCPYCGADLTESKEQEFDSIDESPFDPAEYNENISSLYPPPHQSQKFEPEKTPEEPQFSEEEEKSKPLLILPIFLVSMGAMLLALGLFILVFSTNGAAILKWNAKYWFVYLALSIPFLVLGVKSLNRLEEES